MKKKLILLLTIILIAIISTETVFAVTSSSEGPSLIVETPEVKSVSLSTTEYVYNGKAKKPSVIAIDENGKEIAKENISIKYSSNTDPGKAKAKISFKNGFSGSQTLYFTILPKKAGKPSLKQYKQKQLTITVAEDKTASGYQIKYSTSKNLKKSKTIELKRNKGLSIKVAKLESGKKYYVTVRNYKSKGGKRYYGEWSKTVSKTLTSNAPHPDLPDEMLESYVVDSMRYIGYKVEKQSKDRSFLQDYASGPRTPYKYLTGITYNGTPKGTEKIKDKSTVSGYAPNVKYFKNYGLVCASYVSYYYLNYLPNIAGVDTSYIKKAIDRSGARPQTCDSWASAAKYLVKKGKAKVVDRSYSSLPGATLSKLKIGDLICFSVPNMGLSCGHVAVYAGTNNEGHHFVAHVGDDAGPVFQTLERFENIVHQYDGCAYSVVYRFIDLPASEYEYKVSLSKSTYKYTGSDIEPKVKVLDAAGNKIPSKYYTIHYSNNKKVGTAKVNVVFKGKYRGAKNLTFKIKK